MRLWSLSAVALLIAAPSTLFAQDHTDAKAEITAASEAFDAAYNAADAAAISAMYTNDAVVYPPGGEPVEGMEAISAWFAGGLVEGGPTLDLQTGDVFAIEGAALETGVAWSHTEEGWRMARDMWNSNMARD